jgi:division protein CdvB (Snf7/Vps24/ESCRT-III family)
MKTTEQILEHINDMIDDIEMDKMFVKKSLYQNMVREERVY